MSENQPAFSKPVIWVGAILVILVGFVALPAAIWILPFLWLDWSRWILIPMCAVGTLGYFLVTWWVLQALARGAADVQPDLQLVEQPEDPDDSPERSEAARAVYEEVLETEEDPDVREVVQDALDRSDAEDADSTDR